MLVVARRSSLFARRALASTLAVATLAAAPLALPVTDAYAAALPADVEIAAGEDVVGWVALQSLQAVTQAVKAVGTRAKLLPPNADPDKMLKGALEGMAAQMGLAGTGFLATDAPIYAFFQDRNLPADGGPQLVLGLVVMVPIVSKAALMQAAAGSPNLAEANGHDLALDPGTGMPLYIDVVGSHAVVTVDPTRFSQVQPFVKKLQGIDVPGMLYAGVSMEDLSRTRAPMIEAAVAELEDQAQRATGGTDADKTAAALAKTVRQWLKESARIEFIVRADTKAFGMEGRVTAKPGTELGKALDTTRGRMAAPMASLLPANSYFAFASSTDPSSYKERMDDAMALLKTVLKLSDSQVGEFSAKIAEWAGLQDGTVALGMYADKGAALAGTAVVGAADGTKAWESSRQLMAKILGLLLQKMEADGAMTNNPFGPALKESIQQASPAPLVTQFGPMLAEKGVHVMMQSANQGGAACDSLMVRFDFAKAGTGSDVQKIKALFGGQTGLTACTGPKRLAFAIGPSSVDRARAAATGKPAGLTGAASWKAAGGSLAAASVAGIFHPALTLAAWKALLPEDDAARFANLKLPDRAVTAACQNRTRSLGCGFDVPTDLIVAAILAVRGE